MIVLYYCTSKLRNSYGLCQIYFLFGMKCLFLWYEFSVNVYLICKIYKYWQQIAEQQIVTAYLCQHVYRYHIFYQELEKFELMRRREDCYLRSIWNGRDWQERKRPFSNSHQFKKFFSNSLILDKNLKLYRFQIKSLRLRVFVFINLVSIKTKHRKVPSEPLQNAFFIFSENFLPKSLTTHLRILYLCSRK